MNDLPDQIENLVKNAMKENLAGSKGQYPFLDPEDYKTKTGKRFRMTKAQLEAGKSRQQSFEEFMQKMGDKV